MVSDEKKKRFQDACKRACDSYEGLYLEEAYVGDDMTHIAIMYIDEYYTHAETFFDFYTENEASLTEIAKFFAEAAKNHQLAEGDVTYYGTYDDELGEAEGVSQDDLEHFQYQFENACEYFAASLAANALQDEGGGYLVVAFGVRWNGASGYKLADSASEATIRDYDATFKFSELNEEKGYANLVESSHDCPMGAGVTVIALTEEERERIENEMDVDEVIEWARARTGE